MRSLFQPSSTKYRMPLVDLLLRRQPVRPHRLAIEEASRRLAFIGPANLHLRPVHPAGGSLEAASRHGHRPDLGPDLNPGVGDAIDRGLELQLEVVELLHGAEERVDARAALHGPTDDGTILDGETMTTVQVHPAVQRRPVEEINPTVRRGPRSGRRRVSLRTS